MKQIDRLKEEIRSAEALRPETAEAKETIRNFLIEKRAALERLLKSDQGILASNYYRANPPRNK